MYKKRRAVIRIIPSATLKGKILRVDSSINIPVVLRVITAAKICSSSEFR